MLEQDARASGRVLVIGHRGAAGHAPENTLASFAKAWELGADLLELDVHLTRDGEFVVIHDGDVSRTTDGQGRVQEMTAAQIKRLDAGGRFDPRFAGERVPLLVEVLEWARGRIPLVIEVKGDPLPPPGVAERLVQVLGEFGVLDEVAVISFHHPVVREMKELEPRLATGVLLAGQPADPVGMARAALADSVRLSWPYWTPEMVREVHAAGLVASAWTANDEAVMEYLVAMGVDSIATDYPDRLRACVDRMGRGWRR